MNTVKLKLQSADGGLDKINAEAIRIPTGDEAEKFYLASGGQSPSILLIDKSPSPGRTKLNKYGEVPRIPSRSRIPVLQRSTGPSSFLKTSIHGQPLSASSRKSSVSNQKTSSLTFPADKATYENILGQRASRNLRVLPAIASNSVEQSKSPTVPPPTAQDTGAHSPRNTLPYNASEPKQYYHVTNAKPVFQMKAEYNNMLQKYASNMEQQQHQVPYGQHTHAPGVPCKGCGRHVGQPKLNPAMEQSYVQQWLVDPNHPYQLPAPATGLSQSTGLPQNLGSPQPTPRQADEGKHTVSTVPLVFNSPANNGRKQQQSKQPDVPIRYTQAPTTQMVSKTSGKLLSPEDALKRTLKRKKIPPLTKRNSLRSIFSDNSSNLEKIAEGDEDRESDAQSGGKPKSRGTDKGLSSPGKKLMRGGSKKSFEPGTEAYGYYALLCRLLVEGGGLALVAVFNTVYSPLTLSDNLSKPQLQKTLQRMRSQGALSADYWQLLYPKKKSAVSADSFGSNLLLILLKSICHLSPPYPNGWTEMPLPKDKGLSADLARITWYRKNLVSLVSLSEQEFSTMWGQLASILIRLSETTCTAVVKRVQREVLDADSQSFYIEALASSLQEQVAIDNHEHQPGKSQQTYSSRKVPVTVPRNINSSLSGKSSTFVVTSTNESSDRAAAGGSNHGIAGKNALLMCYKALIDTARVEHCMSHLVSRNIISREQKQGLVKSSISPQHKMKELLALLTENSDTPYEDLLASLQKEYPDMVQLLLATYSCLPKLLCTTDAKEYIKEHLKRHYSTRYKHIRPYFWDQSTVTDFKSHYIHLDITDAKGLKSNIPRSRRYQIEKVFGESSRPHRVLMEGQAGSGKTLYCNKLAYDWSRGDCWLTFDFIILLDMHLIEGSIEDAIYNQLQFFNDEVVVRPEEIMSVLYTCQRRLLFIIDTYDTSTTLSPQVLDLLQGNLLEESSIFMTCLPEQVSNFLPLCDKRLVNLGLDKARQDQLIGRYALLNRGQAEEYASSLCETVRYMARENEYMMRVPQLLNLLCMMAQNEELREQTSTLSLQLQTAFDIYPFVYCIQKGIHYDVENPPNDVLYALKQLQTLALETVIETPSTIMSLEHVQQKYGCKLLMQMALLEPYEFRRDSKRQQMLAFKSRTMQEFMAAMRLSQLPSDQFRKYAQRLLNDASLSRTLVHFVGCIQHSPQPSSNATLMSIFNQLGKQNLSKHKPNKDEPVALGDLSLSLDCVNECESKKDVIRVISQSLPSRLTVSLDQIFSTTTVRGLNLILEKNFSRVSHISVTLNSSTHFNMETLKELAYSIRRSTSVTDLYVSYTSTELLTHFLSHITDDYRANLLTIVCESKAPPSEKLTASTYTLLKSCISNLSDITTFTLVGCKNSLALRNIVRHLPPILATLEIKECLLDSVSALDISAYLERAEGLFVLSLEHCELADGATGMNLFKGLRSNKSLVNLKLRGSALNTQALKVLCEALKFNRVLKQIDLTQLELPAAVCSGVASAVSVSSSIKELKISTSQVCSEGTKLLSEIEKEGFKLTQES